MKHWLHRADERKSGSPDQDPSIALIYLAYKQIDKRGFLREIRCLQISYWPVTPIGGVYYFSCQRKYGEMLTELQRSAASYSYSTTRRRGRMLHGMSMSQTGRIGCTAWNGGDALRARLDAAERSASVKNLLTSMISVACGVAGP